MIESRNIEKENYLSRHAHERTVALRDDAARQAAKSGDEAEWLRWAQEELPRFIPFLTDSCGLKFRG